MYNQHNFPRIAIFLRDLEGGGIQKTIVNLINAMVDKNIIPDLLLTSARGSFLKEVSSEVRLINLNSKKLFLSIPKLTNYLKKEKPDVLLSANFNGNIAAFIARHLARIPTSLFMTAHNTLSIDKYSMPLYTRIPILSLMRWTYPFGDILVSASEGTARDLEIELGLKKGSVNVLYNPVINDEIFQQAEEPNEHPWFNPDQPPVFLTVGRLNKQKNHKNLITAFADLRSRREARLMILGEGELRTELESLTKKLGIESDVFMPGFIDNPYSYMSRANAFVLSSDYEALPTVLIEAMACGCPVISTNCPHGPVEILKEGKYGFLVPENDSIALARGMEKMLEQPVISNNLLIQRAKDFSTEKIVSKYLELMRLSTLK
ncbi:glycosyltransferase [Mastigocoleus testarum]|uniref:Glycosyl transferase family 1 n=1 Tax=Mastigocoleus testarum BC008 TaxID=371196 RepID=A0A0V7ZNA5_9CYAN|nr:glycosyltransferase [Mastigocoleus testarum]KST66012.1 hypothetical protein BC008_23850 [Mastigocoleus testarum BC008]